MLIYYCLIKICRNHFINTVERHTIGFNGSFFAVIWQDYNIILCTIYVIMWYLWLVCLFTSKPVYRNVILCLHACSFCRLFFATLRLNKMEANVDKLFMLKVANNFPELRRALSAGQMFFVCVCGCNNSVAAPSQGVTVWLQWVGNCPGYWFVMFLFIYIILLVSGVKTDCIDMPCSGYLAFYRLIM